MNNMTDAEIIKAFECCEANEGGNPNCEECPYFSLAEKPSNCYIMARKQALDLINRQKAEIERLEKENTALAKRFYKEGVKDLAKRLKESKHECGCNYRKKPVYAVTEDKIDNLVKEMVGENK